MERIVRWRRRSACLVFKSVTVFVAIAVGMGPSRNKTAALSVLSFARLAPAVLRSTQSDNGKWRNDGESARIG